MNRLFILLVVLASIASCQSEAPTDSYTPLNYTDSLALSEEILRFNSNDFNDRDSLKIASEAILNNYPKNRAEASVKIAYGLYAKSELGLTKHYFSLAAKEFLNDSLFDKYAEQLTNIGVVEELLGNYPSAITYYFNALSIFNELNMELKAAAVYNNLGIVYQQLGDYEKSIQFYQKSVNICKTLEREDLCASKYNNIATVFEKQDNELDSALFYYGKAIDIYKKLEELNSMVTLEANIANVYIQQNRFVEAEALLNHAESIEGSSDMSHSIYEFKSALYLKQNNFFEAEQNALKSIERAKKNDYKEHELTGLSALIACYEKQNKFQLAYSTLQEHNLLKEELKGIEQQSQINKWSILYEMKEKDNQIEILQLKDEISQKRDRIFAIITFAGITSFIVLFYIYFLHKKHAKLQIKSMEYNIAEYIKQLHDFEAEIHENELANHKLFLEKIKQFNLTEREEDVVLYISKGYKNIEIAEKMFVSINTVKTHIKNVFIKLDVRNRIEATNKVKV
ncbi:MAG: tetratricopeptide repeat protein [Crocinitomix sp.]|nr:tetratricopeptide repeat protein [Crocinitomix sp.]